MAVTSEQMMDFFTLMKNQAEVVNLTQVTMQQQQQQQTKASDAFTSQLTQITGLLGKLTEATCQSEPKMSARADAADVPIDDDEDGVPPETLRD